MRRGGWIAAVLCLTLGGCATLGDGYGIDECGRPTVLLDTPANAPPADDDELAVPPPTGIRAIQSGPEASCVNGHTFHSRCVTSRGGRLCFFETDDGTTFDCTTPKCNVVPNELLAWCSQR